KLLFNGQELASDVPPQIIDGRVLVPVRVVSEAFKAEVNWDEENNTVAIYASEIEALKMQVQRLEAALAPADPTAAATTWAEGVKTRNGALQYAVMSPELKAENYERLAANMWSTGTSSPWVDSYTVSEGEKIDPETYLYEVSFTYTDSTGASSIETETITVKKYEANWFVSAIKEKPDIVGQITKITDSDTGIVIMVEDNTAAEPYDKAAVTITADTKIYRGQDKELLAGSDLKEGDMVEVVFRGPALMSYPVQVGADSIRLLNE
ncbi:MAG: copper amine oxidase N-terminal domain-containing protein, partial [Clostridia bacterium]|nr:copper amine oxidase N-terminal domain-containing protein [Clostridia bacterium]